MLQLDIDSAVARATGESRRMITRRGFSLEQRPTARADDLRIGLDCPGCGRLAAVHPGTFTRCPCEAECAGCDAVYDADPGELLVIETPARPAGRM